MAYLFISHYFISACVTMLIISKVHYCLIGYVKSWFHMVDGVVKFKFAGSDFRHHH